MIDIGRLAYDIGTNDSYEDSYVEKDIFDFTEYSDNSKIHRKINKKAIGKIKDETKCAPIVEFVGLKSKIYSLVKEMYLLVKCILSYMYIFISHPLHIFYANNKLVTTQ